MVISEGLGRGTEVKASFRLLVRPEGEELDLSQRTTPNRAVNEEASAGELAKHQEASRLATMLQGMVGLGTRTRSRGARRISAPGEIRGRQSIPFSREHAFGSPGAPDLEAAQEVGRAATNPSADDMGHPSELWSARADKRLSDMIGLFPASVDGSSGQGSFRSCDTSVKRRSDGIGGSLMARPRSSMLASVQTSDPLLDEAGADDANVPFLVAADDDALCRRARTRSLPTVLDSCPLFTAPRRLGSISRAYLSAAPLPLPPSLPSNCLSYPLPSLQSLSALVFGLIAAAQVLALTLGLAGFDSSEVVADGEQAECVVARCPARVSCVLLDANMVRRAVSARWADGSHAMLLALFSTALYLGVSCHLSRAPCTQGGGPKDGLPSLGRIRAIFEMASLAPPPMVVLTGASDEGVRG